MMTELDRRDDDEDQIRFLREYNEKQRNRKPGIFGRAAGALKKFMRKGEYRDAEQEKHG